MSNPPLKKAVREVVAPLLRAGCTVEQIGKHPKPRAPTGAVYGIPGSPSDFRAMANLRADLRRFARENNLKVHECTK